MSVLFHEKYGKNLLYVISRLLIVIVGSLLIYYLQPRTINTFESVQDIAIPAIIGIIGAGIVAVMMATSTRLYIPFIIMPADWLLVGSYVYYFSYNKPLLMSGLTIAILITGVMRIGAVIGVTEAVGIIIAVFVGLGLQPTVGISNIMNNIAGYVPDIAILSVVAFLSLAWSYALDEENSKNRRLVRKEVEESRTRLESMRERARSVADMALALNSSLNYERILDAALDVGRMSIRTDLKQRVISLAVMVTGDDDMEIQTARGLQHVDLAQHFSGKRGIIAQALEEGKPVIIPNGENDPELSVLTAFANIKTTLAIPLRANLESYGVLIYGSSAENAINEDHIDTLATIGVQATIALQNAVLYGNLREEKERLIRIEESARKALVRDLHDIPTQTISAVVMHLSTIPMLMQKKPEKLLEEIESMRSMAQRAVEEIRHVMFTLRPLSLETNGLSTALDQLADKMQKTYKQPMQAKIDPRIEQVLNHEAQGTLFYLIEEAANNARKYAEASMVQVQGVIQENEVIIRIRDNGKGFDMDMVNSGYEKRGSFGMVNMRERAELVNGALDMQSSPGKGTLVTVRIPIEEKTLKNLKTDEEPIVATAPRKSFKTKQYSGPMSPST